MQKIPHRGLLDSVPQSTCAHAGAERRFQSALQDGALSGHLSLVCGTRLPGVPEFDAEASGTQQKTDEFGICLSLINVARAGKVLTRKKR